MADSKKINTFQKWVFWTGVFNIIAFTGLTCPFTLKRFLFITNKMGALLGFGGADLLFPADINHLVLINMLGMIVVMLGVMLIIASFNIMERAWYVFWEGLIRIFAFLLIFYFVLFMNAAQALLFFGGIDLLIGLIYMYYIFSIKELKIR
ncbi:MAG: hypothetical protein JRG81_14245 [Deltaproteobacteria bacterium]|nr:hypothetical protein [Deltaproteobacteria bacterium]MBW2181504.1 hypothetical protein [Deltaproteobacteria bacterium]